MYLAVKTKSSGFTLLELCVALFLGEILILIIMLVFSYSSRLSIEITQTAEQLENTRYAFFFLRRLVSHSIQVIRLLPNETFYSKEKIKPNTDACRLVFLNQNNFTYADLFISKAPSETGQEQFALYMKEEKKPRIEIAPGFSDMRILYGIKSKVSGDICHYVRKPEITEKQKIASMKLTLFTKENQFARYWKLYLALKTTP